MRDSTGLPREGVRGNPLACIPGKGRTAILVVCVLAVACSVHAAVKTLQNDGFEPHHAVTCQLGLMEGEIAAARFTAAPEDYPFRIERVAALLCPDGPATSITLRIWLDDGSSLQPGLQIFEGDFPVTPNSTSFNLFDLGSEYLIVDSGSVRIGLVLKQSPLPGVATDLDGTITSQANFVYADPGVGTNWYYLETLGISGDWIIRLEIDNFREEEIFSDGFESGSTAVWSSTVP